MPEPAGSPPDSPRSVNGTGKSHSGPSGPGILYRVVITLAAPLILGHLCWRARKDGGLIYLFERLGFYRHKPHGTPKRQLRGKQPSDIQSSESQPPEKNTLKTPVQSACRQRPIWIHAASVGEVNTVKPLLKALIARYPNDHFVVTTATPTGKVTINNVALPRTQHYYLPLDYRFAVNGFYQHVQPRCGFIVETELWPGLYQQSPVPLVLINARLSEKTIKAATGWLEKAYRYCVSQLALIIARQPSDEQAYRQLGATTVEQVGNLKQAITLPDHHYTASLSHPFANLHRFALLASTHHDEEVQLATRWLQQNNPPLLVIAPRHPDRANDLKRQLYRLTKEIALRSHNDTVDDTTAIYIADTLGEMDLWYLHASAIFLGGSLTAVGGHNMLEPAGWQRSVITGPHLHNFDEEVAKLQANDAITVCADAAQVIDALIDQYDNTGTTEAMGKRAADTIKPNQQVLPDYLTLLAPYIDR